MRQRVLDLDEALLRLRKLWAASKHRAVDSDGRHIDMSSLLVVEACARQAAAGLETTIADIARWAAVESSTATRFVDRAVSSGYVLRDASSVSGRRVSVRLTKSGQALQRRASKARTTWLAEQVADWSDDDLDSLATLLARFAAQL